MESIPSAYVAWRVGTSNRVAVPARQAGNRFLGSLKGLQIRALLSTITIEEMTTNLCQLWGRLYMFYANG